MLNAELIKQLASQKAKIECFSISLIQNKNSGPLEFEGPGCIFFDEDKTLKIKMYSNKTSSSPGMFNFFFGNELGVVPDDRYFTVSAKDDSGNSWTNNRIYLNDGVHLGVHGTTLDFEVENLSYTKSINKSAAFNGAVIIPGTFKLPYTDYVDMPDGVRSLSRLTIDDGARSYTITQKDAVFEIEIIDSTQSIEIDQASYLVEGLGIAIGRLMEPVLIILTGGDKYTVFIRSAKPKEYEPISSPIVKLRYNEPNELSSFLKSYIRKRSATHNHLVNYWHRLNEIPLLNTEAAALILCVNIEGMIKNYFSHGRTIETNIIDEIELTKKELKTLKLPDHIKSHLGNFLSSIKKPSISSILSCLADEKKIDAAHACSWKNLRHVLAHADNSISEPAKFEQFVVDLHNCLSLFNDLIRQSIESHEDRQETLAEKK